VTPAATWVSSRDCERLATPGRCGERPAGGVKRRGAVSRPPRQAT